METERKALPDNDYEATSGRMEIATLDDMKNPYLFGEKFEETLSKITSAKQK